MENPVREDAGERDRDRVQSLVSGLAVIKAFDAIHRTMSISEVAEATGLNRASARRFLLTLQELGYVRSSGRRYSLGPRVLELAYHYLGAAGLPEIARPHMDRLAEETSESCSLAVLDGNDIVYVQRVTAARFVRVMISIGTRFPAYSTSMGRVLISDREDAWIDDFLHHAPVGQPTLRIAPPVDVPKIKAEIEKIRTQGYYVLDNEVAPGLRVLAVPLRDNAGRMLASMAITAHDSSENAEHIIRDALPLLRAAARAVEADLAQNGVTAFSS
jgi:IclR family pca regulon transcriptional regulator